jgi:DNA adenine methylase
MIFRYPGGKSRLLEEILPRITQTDRFCDAFVGGGSVLCAMAERYPSLQLHANDYDKNVAAFWDIISCPGNDVDELLKLVDRKPSIDLFNELRSTGTDGSDRVGRAYHTIFFNRTTFSGISTAGPIGGKGQKSKWAVGCRYNADKIKAGVMALITLMRGRLKTTALHFQNLLAVVSQDTFVYLDPPYYHKGNILYPVGMSKEEHVTLAEMLVRRRNWLLSYDGCMEIREIYPTSAIIEIETRSSISGSDRKGWAPKTEFLIRPKIQEEALMSEQRYFKKVEEIVKLNAERKVLDDKIVILTSECRDLWPSRDDVEQQEEEVSSSKKRKKGASYEAVYAFLGKNPEKSFKAKEVAEGSEVTVASARGALQKLLADGKAEEDTKHFFSLKKK